MPKLTYRDEPMVMQGATRYFDDGRVVVYVWLNGKRVVVSRTHTPAGKRKDPDFVNPVRITRSDLEEINHA